MFITFCFYASGDPERSLIWIGFLSLFALFLLASVNRSRASHGGLVPIRGFMNRQLAVLHPWRPLVVIQCSWASTVVSVLLFSAVHTWLAAMWFLMTALWSGSVWIINHDSYWSPENGDVLVRFTGVVAPPLWHHKGEMIDRRVADFCGNY